jgi:hypothetical protein
MKKIGELFAKIENSKVNKRDIGSDNDEKNIDFGSADIRDLSNYATMSLSHRDIFSKADYTPDELEETTVVNYTEVHFLEIS